MHLDTGAIEPLLAVAAVLVLVSIFASKISGRFGIPSLLIFLAIGMLAGSEGPGGIYFDDARLASAVGVVCLTLILYAGGVSTRLDEVRPVLREGALLATAGVVVTALVVGAVAAAITSLDWRLALLLGAIVASTDAAAVFAVLDSRGLRLRRSMRALLELESGSNDPMAVFLTVACIELVTEPTVSPASLAGLFVVQMGLGGLLGYALGRLMVYTVNKLRLQYDGLYPVLSLAFVVAVYALTAWLGGSGFLAVYVAGVVAGNRAMIHGKSLARFHDGLAWLAQITMFLTLGLLVFPSRIVPVIGIGLLVTVALIFVARPLAVFAVLVLSRMQVAEKAFVSWVGLRGAVPIVLGTFPLLAGVARADELFNIVFFVVLGSALLQGTTVAQAARLLHVDGATDDDRGDRRAVAFGDDAAVAEYEIPPGSPAAGRQLAEADLPDTATALLLRRGDEYVQPTGSIILRAGDMLLVVVDGAAAQRLERQLGLRRRATSCFAPGAPPAPPPTGAAARGAKSGNPAAGSPAQGPAD